MASSPKAGGCQQELDDDPMFVIKNLDTGLEMRIDDFDKLANIATAERQEQEHAAKKGGINLKGTKAIKHWATATTKKASAAAKKAVTGIKDVASELKHDLHVPHVLGKQKSAHLLDNSLSKASSGGIGQQSSTCALSNVAMTKLKPAESSQGPWDAESGQSAHSLASAAVSELTPTSSKASKQLQDAIESAMADMQATSATAQPGHAVTSEGRNSFTPAIAPAGQNLSSTTTSGVVASGNAPAAATASPSSPTVPAVARLVTHKRSSTAVHQVVLAQVLEGSCGVVWAVAFSKDGSFLATAGQDGVLRIWQLTSSRDREPRRSWVFSVPETSNITGSEGSSQQQQQNPQEDQGPGASACAELQGSPTLEDCRGSDQTVVDGAAAEPAQLDTSGLQQIEQRQKAGDPAQGLQHQHQQHEVVPDQPPTVDFGPYFSSQPVRAYVGHTEDILDVSWSAAGFILTASLDKSVRLWHVSQPACLREFWHTDFVTSVQFHPLDAQRFVSGSIDGKIRLWSVPEASVIATAQLHQDMVTAVAFSLTGERVVAGTMRGRCRFYELADGKLEYVAQVDVRNQRGAHANGKKVTGVCAVPGQRQQFLITTNDSRLRLLDGYGQVLKFKGHRNTGTQIRANLSADGAQVVCGSDDGWVYMWQMSAAGAATTAADTAGQQRQYRGLHNAQQSQQPSTGKNAVYQAYLAHDAGVPVPAVAFAPTSACAGRSSVLAGGGGPPGVLTTGSNWSSVADADQPSAVGDIAADRVASGAAAYMRVQHLLVSGGFDGAIRVHELT